MQALPQAQVLREALGQQIEHSDDWPQLRHGS